MAKLCPVIKDNENIKIIMMGQHFSNRNKMNDKIRQKNIQPVRSIVFIIALSDSLVRFEMGQTRTDLRQNKNVISIIVTILKDY